MKPLDHRERNLPAFLVIILQCCIFQHVWAADGVHYCLPTNLPNTRGSISLEGYKPNSFCSTTLSAPGAPSMYVHFYENDLEVDDDILFDYLLMFDGQDCMAKRYATGNILNGLISSPRSNFTLLFISDPTVEGDGFDMRYNPDTKENEARWNPTIHPPESNILHNCGDELNGTTSRKIIWNGHERVNNLCIWRIRNENGGAINLTIDDLQLHGDSAFVRILDGPDCNSKVIHFGVGNTSFQPLTIQSSSDVMLLVLGVPQAFNDSMNATYSFISKVQSGSGSLSSPSIGTDLTYPTTATMRYDSSTSSSTETETDWIYSTTDEEQYDWNISDFDIYEPGTIKLNADCGEEIVAKTQGNLAWKKMKPENRLCVWKVRSERGQPMKVALDDYQLHSGGYIRILDGSPNREKVIGQYAGCMMRQSPLIYANSGIIIIELHMRSAVFGDYFRAHFSTVGIGAEGTNETWRNGVAGRSPLGYLWLSLLLGALVYR